MKRTLVFLVCFSLLVFVMAGTSYSWQGRMGGMGDPYGLIADESDFLIHPSKIATGEGIRFYGNYRFTYTDLMDRDFDLDWFNPATGALWDWDDVDISGDELRHNALLGAAFPLGPGRMGLLFTYEGQRSDYNGDWVWMGPGPFDTIEAEGSLDNFALRLLYGLPMGGLNLGGEIQFAYCQEEQGNFVYRNDLFSGELNSEMFAGFFSLFPYNSTYWETLLKGSLEAAIGPADVEFTLKGGFIFAGDNGWEYEYQAPVGTPTSGWDLGGGVDGWRIGGDLWVRYPVASFTLPFLLRVDYQEKSRDGDGGGTYAWAGDSVEYENSEKSLDIAVGGGLDKELNAGTRVAGGLYYNYLQHKDTLSWYDAWGGGGWDTEDLVMPDSTEHQFIVRFAGEHEFSPSVALRVGLNFFYGWVHWNGSYYYNITGTAWDDANVSMDGYHWGIGASLGGTVRFNNLTLEPFVNAGYQQLNLNGDGTWYDETGLTDLLEAQVTRSEWYVGGGFSVLFDLP